MQPDTSPKIRFPAPAPRVAGAALGRALALVLKSFVLVLVICSAGLSAALDFPGVAPGESTAAISGDQLRLANDLIEVTWTFRDQRLRPASVSDRLNHHNV